MPRPSLFEEIAELILDRHRDRMELFDLPGSGGYLAAIRTGSQVSAVYVPFIAEWTEALAKAIVKATNDHTPVKLSLDLTDVRHDKQPRPRR